MNIIVKPLISEKMNKATEKMSNRYGFVVDKRANKIQIRNAVESFYNVKVVDVSVPWIRECILPITLPVKRNLLPLRKKR